MTESTESTTPDTADIVKMYEEMFSYRYTDEDPDYVETKSKPIPPCPCVVGYFLRPKRNYNDRGQDNRNRGQWGQRDGGHRDNRDRGWHGNRNRQYNDNRHERGGNYGNDRDRHYRNDSGGGNYRNDRGGNYGQRYNPY